MNFKTTYILFALFAVLLVVLGVTLWLDPSPADVSDFVFPSAHDKRNPLKIEEITEVEIARREPEETIRIEKDEALDRWFITSPIKAEADDITVTGLVRQILNAEQEEDANLPGLDQLGLAPPKSVITLKKGDERKLVLNVGDVSPGERDAVIYVTSSDRPKTAMSVQKNGLRNVLDPLAAFRSRALLTSAESDIKGITLIRMKDGKQEGPTIELARKEVDDWHYKQPIEGEADTSSTNTVIPAGQPPTGMKSLLYDLTNLRVDYNDPKDHDFVANNVPSKDLGKYSLGAQSEYLQIEVVLAEKDGNTRKVTSYIGVGEKAGGTPPKYYATRNDGYHIVKVPADKVDPLLELTKNPEALRDRHLVRLDAARQPDVIRIKNEYGTMEFYRPDKERPWVLYRGDTAENVDQQMLTGLLTLLGQDGQVDAFVEKNTPEKELGLDNPTAVVSLWVNGIVSDKKPPLDKTRPKLKDPDKPTVRLEFGNRDRVNRVAAVKRTIDNERKALLKVKELVFERVNQGPLAYLDRVLPQFNEGTFDATLDVTRLELKVGDRTTIVTREKKDAPWKIEQPESLAGRTADETAIASALRALNRLHATRLIAEKVGDPALQTEYGLKTPQAQALVTVTRNNKSEVYRYDFGKPVGETEIFARQGGAFAGDIIFTVGKTTLGELDRDLVDPGIFDFDPTKARRLKLFGWKKENPIGLPITLDVESKDGVNWEFAKDSPPVGFALNSQRVKGFVDSLSKLRAADFIAHNAKPEAGHELELNTGALLIEVYLDGREKPLQLTVGKLDGSKGYIAISPEQAPGDIFHVSRDIFEGPKSKPSHFGS